MTTPNLHPDHLHPALARISQRRVFFGHQSVGAEIMLGLGELAADLGVPIRIAPDSRPEDSDEAWFVHQRIGRNGDPASKLDAFSEAVREGAGVGAEVAIFKLCYVDVTRKTDIDSLAELYGETFDKLQAQRPNLAIVKTTVPLTTGLTGLRGRLDRALGRPDPAEPDNRARTRFNEFLRCRQAAGGSLFDLAAVEAGSHGPPDGPTPALLPQLTRDGGHLNQRGRKLAAAALVDTLGKLL